MKQTIVLFLAALHSQFLSGQDAIIQLELSRQNVAIHYSTSGVKVNYEINQVSKGLEILTIKLINDDGFIPTPLKTKW